jgi:hypothetical protein
VIAISRAVHEADQQLQVVDGQGDQTDYFSPFSGLLLKTQLA